MITLKEALEEVFTLATLLILARTIHGENACRKLVDALAEKALQQGATGDVVSYIREYSTFCEVDWRKHLEKRLEELGVTLP